MDERGEVVLGERRSDSALTDLNELGANPGGDWPLGEVSLGRRGVRLVDEGEVAVRAAPFELDRVAPVRDEGVTLPDGVAGVTLPEVLRDFAGEPGRPGLVFTGEVEVLFSHKEAAARTLLGPPAPPLEADAVRGFGDVLSVDGTLALPASLADASSVDRYGVLRSVSIVVTGSELSARWGDIARTGGETGLGVVVGFES